MGREQRARPGTAAPIKTVQITGGSGRKPDKSLHRLTALGDAPARDFGGPEVRRSAPLLRFEIPRE
jgi:hypothetical protein